MKISRIFTLKKKYNNLIIENHFENILNNALVKNVLIAIPPTQSFTYIKKR